ncbi:hypothetical protein [Ferrovibrio terrae]|uniref:hypothetical protein n=1 Tax=Ferrovibrio terrae TaxID=2594003 RepID=UPI0031382254
MPVLGHAQADTDPEGFAAADNGGFRQQRGSDQIVTGKLGLNLRLGRKDKADGQRRCESGLLKQAEKTEAAHAIKIP